MKKSVPVQMVYKIVQLQDARMFSANSNDHNLARSSTQEHSCVVEYKLKHRIFPQSHLPYLFVCTTAADAAKALKFYNKNSDKPCVILKGLAGRVREFDAFEKRAKPYHINTNCLTFRSFVCDWFIPTNVVK